MAENPPAYHPLNAPGGVFASLRAAQARSISKAISEITIRDVGDLQNAYLWLRYPPQLLLPKLDPELWRLVTQDRPAAIERSKKQPICGNAWHSKEFSESLAPADEATSRELYRRLDPKYCVAYRAACRELARLIEEKRKEIDLMWVCMRPAIVSLTEIEGCLLDTKKVDGIYRAPLTVFHHSCLEDVIWYLEKSHGERDEMRRVTESKKWYESRLDVVIQDLERIKAKLQWQQRGESAGRNRPADAKPDTPKTPEAEAAKATGTEAAQSPKPTDAAVPAHAGLKLRDAQTSADALDWPVGQPEWADRFPFRRADVPGENANPPALLDERDTAIIRGAVPDFDPAARDWKREKQIAALKAYLMMHCGRIATEVDALTWPDVIALIKTSDRPKDGGAEETGRTMPKSPNADAEMLREIANALEKLESIDPAQNPDGVHQAGMVVLRLGKKYLPRIVELRDTVYCPPGVQECVLWLDTNTPSLENLEQHKYDVTVEFWSLRGWQPNHAKPFSEQLRMWAKEIEGSAAKQGGKDRVLVQDDGARDQAVLDIKSALGKHDGVVTSAAKELRITPKTLYARMKHLGISLEDERRLIAERKRHTTASGSSDGK